MRVVVTHMNLTLYWVPRLRELARAVARQGGEVVGLEVASRGTPYDFAADPDRNGPVRWITLFDEDIRALPPRTLAAALSRKLDEVRGDVVLAGAIAFVAGATAVRWCRQHRRPVIIMDDARRRDVPRSRLTNCVKRRIYRNVDAVLIPAASHTPSFLDWGLPAERIFHGVSVVDNDWFARRAHEVRAAPDDARRKLALPERFFLGVGRQIPIKNWEGLITEFARYRRSRPEAAWGLVLVGDGPIRADLEGLARRTAPGAVHFLPLLPQQDVAACYALAGALVLPSFGETWGLVVNEAMAAGLPVLVSDGCGCCDALVRDGRNGWTFSPHPPGQLGGLLARLADLDPHEREKMAAASREIIADWPAKRFADGACQAIAACGDSAGGFHSPADRALLRLWKGRFRPK